MPRTSDFGDVLDLPSSQNNSDFSQPPFPLSWDYWELDAAFLTALNYWDAENPETTLERVFQSASLAIDQGKDLLEVIPDVPFPAKSLVMAVLQLVKLGATISGAQKELVGFAKDIIDWVNGVKASFVNSAKGNLKFTRMTWENLAMIRELVEEIVYGQRSDWHRDGRWSLKNGRINKEIIDFKARLDYAHKVFQDSSIVVISGGLDSILQKLRALLNSSNKIVLTLEGIRKTQEDHHRTIIDELRDHHDSQSRHEFFKSSLYARTAVAVGYDQQEKIPCDEDTRMEILAEIRAWVNDVSYGSENFLWLTGDPGCGKSAVTASVARECRDCKTLWAQFFINRNNDETTNPNLYFPTIARQLAEYSDVVERQIFNTLSQKTSLLDRISCEQVTRLFIDALGTAASINPKAPVVVVIDGLDETRRDKLEETAAIISTLFGALVGYPNAKVFISSRTEHGIQRPFSKAMLDRRVKNIHLDTNSKSSFRDVEIYLRKRFGWIAENFGYDPNTWPGEDRLRSLASHASGHFIWAATVTKFLEEQMDEWGHERLDLVMENLGTREGKQDIKTLYGLILQLTYQKSKDAWAFETFRRVVGVVATSLEPMSIAQLEILLDLKKDLHSSFVDLPHFVRRLRTILVAGTGDITGETILRLHKSFFEYITSNDSEDRFRVCIEASNAELAFQCFRQITKVYSMVQDTQYSPGRLEVLLGLSNLNQLRYSLRFCLSHLPKMGAEPLRAMIDDPNVEPSHLDALLCRSLSVDGCSGPLAFHYPTDTDYIFTSLNNYDLRWDVKDGRYSPETSACLKTGKKDFLCSAISPVGTQIAVAFLSSHNTQISSQCEVEVWDTVVVHSIPFEDLVKSLTFSPDGKHVAALTSGSITQIDVETADITMIKDDMYYYPLDTSLVFSPNGGLHKIVLSNGLRLLIRSKIGHFTERAEMLHQAQCRFMAVSHDCTRILTITRNSVCVWDFHSGDLIQMILSDFDIWYAAISPDNETLVCSDFFGTTYVWNTKTSRNWRKLYGILPNDDWKLHLLNRVQLRYRWGSWKNPITNHFSFSPSGDLFISTSYGVAYLWDSQLEKASLLQTYRDFHWSWFSAGPEGNLSAPCPIFSRNGEHILFFDGGEIEKRTLALYYRAPALHVEWASFSPDGNLHMFALSEGGLLIWNSTSGKRTVRLPFGPKGEVRVVCAAFSPDGSRIAGISNLGDVYMWDTAQNHLLGVSTKPIIMDATSIYFGEDGETIVLVSKTKTITRLLPVNGSHPLGKGTIERAHYFDLDTTGHVYSSETVHNGRLENVRWFPGSSNHSDVFWALVNNHIVRGSSDGSFVIVPVDIKNQEE